MKKLLKLLSVFCLLTCMFVIVEPIQIQAKELPTVETRALVTTIPVNATYTKNSTKVDPGNTVSFTYTLSGSYKVTNNGGTSSVSNVDLSFGSVAVKINGSSTTTVFGRITNIDRRNNSSNVTITYTLQYRYRDSSTWSNVGTYTVTV